MAITCLFRGLIKTILKGIINTSCSCIWELTKFGIVLALAYLIAVGIFYMLEQTITMPELRTASKLMAKRLTGTLAPDLGDINKYPFIVEIPSKISAQSVKRTSKNSEKIAAIQEKFSEFNLEQEEEEGEMIAEAMYDEQMPPLNESFTNIADGRNSNKLQEEENN